MENTLTVRKVIKLRHIIENMTDTTIPNWNEREEKTKDKIYHFMGGKAYIDLLERVLNKPTSSISGQGLMDMTDKTLDLENVIIPPQVSYTLENYIRQYGLNIIDTTMERPKTYLNEKTGRFEELPKEHMDFRHNYFQEIFNDLVYNKSALPVEKLMYEDKGSMVFRYKHAVPIILDIIRERQESGNDNRLLINISSLNYTDIESCKELAYVLLKLNEFVEITHSSALSHSSIYGFLPCVAQMCLDFTDMQTTWSKFKKQAKVGSRFYISTTPNVYDLVEVVENVTTTNKGTDLEEAIISGESISDSEIESLYSIRLIGVKEETGELDEEVSISNENVIESDTKELAVTTPNDQKEEKNEGKFVDKEFTILSKDIVTLEVLVFPIAVFESGDSVLMPTEEEIDYRYEKTRFRERSSITRNLFQDSLYTDESIISKDFDWIKEYMVAERKRYKALGMEMPKLDLEKIISGQESPFKGNMD